jgi:arabinan endo-1,5-alpha-L-arabinosidase
MRRLFPRRLLSLLAAAVAPLFAQPGYVSPLTGSLSTHDPVILKQDSVYYLFHTGNGVQIKTSRDRLAWAPGTPDRVFQEAPAWHARFRNTIDSWAPAIKYWDGKYWLYYSLSNFGERRSAIGLRTNTTLHPSDPAYEWVDHGIVVCTYNNGVTHPECFNANTTSVNTNDTTAFNAIDPDVVLDQNGKPWLSWGSFGSGIQLIPLDRATGKPDSGATPVTIAHRYTTQSASGSGYERSIEAPVITRHGDYFYLWYSYDRCCASTNSTYRVMVTRSSAVTGPYVDKAGNLAHPPYRAPGSSAWQTANAGTLVSRGDSNWYATGHNDILFDKDTVFLVNHGYIRGSGMGNGATRLMIRPLYWDAEGWPTLDSTQGVIAPPMPTSVRGIPSQRQPGEGRFVRPAESFLVPWNGGLRDLRGRETR